MEHNRQAMAWQTKKQAYNEKFSKVVIENQVHTKVRARKKETLYKAKSI